MSEGGDVTRKEVERSLEFLREPGPVRSLMERLPAIIYLDAIGGVADTLYMSPYVETLLGFTVKEWIADPDIWEKQLHPDDRDAMVDLSNKTDASGEPFRAEYRIHAKDGRQFWILEESVRIEDDQGNPLYWQGIMVDITDRKEAERRLYASTARLASIVGLSPDAIIGANLDGLITDWNHGAERMLGYRPEKVVGQPLSMVSTPDQVEELGTLVERAGRRERIKPVEAVWMTMDGQHVDVQLSIGSIEDIEGNLVGLSCVATDISERKT